jgi:hypothetical protein
MRKTYFFLFFFIPILASFIPYLACQFFDSPQLRGFVSAEELFLLLALALPYGKILWNLSFVVAIFGFAFYAKTIDSYAVVGVYLLMFLVASLVPRQKKFLLPIFVVFSMFFFIADCENFFFSTFVLKLANIWELAKFFWWGPILFVAIPLLVVALQYFYARNILWGKNRLEISHPVALAILAISVSLNYGINLAQQRQPIMEFPVRTFFWHILSPGLVGQNLNLQEDIKSVFHVWPKERAVINDLKKNTVMVLVESYGVNKSIPYTKALLAPFDSVKTGFLGLYPREAAHTQGAEWEDFGTPGGNIREKPLPLKFKENDFQTFYLHGYSGSFYERKKNYAKFGFDSLLFRNDLEKRGLSSCRYGFVGICDSSIINYIDSLITDTVPKFIYWTTLDAHPPYEWAEIAKRSPVCKTLSLSDIDCSYFTLQENTMRTLAKLAAKHPECQFIIRGDHRPMGSTSEVGFVQSFYFRWVPLVILNN